MRFRLLVVVVFAVPGVVVGQSTDAHRVTAAAVRFVSDRPGEVIVPVFIGGTGPHHFLLDTGSNRTAVTETLRTALGAQPVAKALVATSVGSIMCVVVRITDVTIGSTRVAALMATSLPSAATRILGAGVAGVIGQDFLSQFNYTLDYRRSRLVWDDAVVSTPGVRLKLVPSEGRFLVTLPQEGALVRFVPDSGADGFVLFDRVGGVGVPIESRSGSFRVGSLSGEGLGRAVVLRDLQVGATRLREQPAAVVLGESGTDAADGLLPLHLFASVSFNNREGYMVVQPR